MREPLRIIPQLEPVTKQAQPLSVETRIELVASIIACVLFDAQQMQQQVFTHIPLGKAPREEQRIYEAIGRQVATYVLKPERGIQAKRLALQTAAAILSAYDEEDAAFDSAATPEMWQSRYEAAFTSALHKYHAELAREEGIQ